jgi:hypothetical protein
VNQGLPDVDGRLTNSAYCILADNVECTKDPISTPLAKNLTQRLARSFGGNCAGLTRLILIDLVLSTDTGDFIKKFSDKGDGRMLKRVSATAQDFLPVRRLL